MKLVFSLPFALLPLLASPVPFVTIEKSTKSGWHHGKGEFVIDRPELWRHVWTAHTKGSIGHPPPPPVDFATETVIAVFGDHHLTTGPTTEVVSIETDGAKVDVHVVDTEPGPACGAFFAESWPFHFVRMPKTSLPVVFHRRTVVHDC